MELPQVETEMSLRFAYYSHHKCATSWTNSILRELCAHMGLNHRTAHGPEQYDAEGGVCPWVRAHEVEFLAYTNAEIEEARTLPRHRGFHVVRDPRDVLVSAYFSHKYSHGVWPELQEHRQELQSVPKEEGLLKEIEFSRQFLEPMRTWDYEQDHVLELKMETLTSRPHQQFRRVLEHLGIDTRAAGLASKVRQWANRVLYSLNSRLHGDLMPPRLTVEDGVDSDIWGSILADHKFEKLTGGRSKGEADPKSHYRKGKPGDWENHFTDRVAKAFERAYGDIVARLGYDKPEKRDAKNL